MFNKDDLIILVNEYVSAATINLDCIDVCESIVGQLVYLYECVKNQCHLDKVFYDENSISYAFVHWKNTCRVSQPTECSDHLILWAEEK